MPTIMNMNSNNAGNGGGSQSGCASGGHGNDGRGAGGNAYSGSSGNAIGGSVYNSGAVMNMDSSTCNDVCHLIFEADIRLQTTAVTPVNREVGALLEAMYPTHLSRIEARGLTSRLSYTVYPNPAYHDRV